MARIAVVHYAEDLPTDPGFTSGRYASLHSVLKNRGHEPIRIAPSYSHQQKAQRPLIGSRLSSSPRDVILVKTPSYTAHRSFARIRHLFIFRNGAARALARIKPDIGVVMIPPVGILSLASQLSGNARTTWIADVEDLWPDAQLATTTGLIHSALQISRGLLNRQTARDLRTAAGIMAISQEYLDWSLQQHAGSGRIPTSVIPLGTGSTPQNGVVDAPSRRGVVFVGTLSKHFSFDAMIKAWRHFAHAHPRLAEQHPLTIYGEGEWSKNLRLLAMDTAHVHLAGRVTHADALHAMRQSALALAPYRQNARMGLPNKLFEYLAAGLPIVSTLKGEMSGFLEAHNVGSTVDEQSPRAYAEAIRGWLVDEKARTNIVEAGPALIRSDFSHDALSEQMADFILDVHQQRISQTKR